MTRLAVSDSHSTAVYVQDGGLKHRSTQVGMGSTPIFGTTNTPPTFTNHAREWLSRMAVRVFGAVPASPRLSLSTEAE